MVATLTRILGPHNLQLAEDAVQEALIKALRHWSYHGAPENPAGWIIRVARNQALDILRREATWRSKQTELALLADRQLDDPETALESLTDELLDDQLRLMFICCHAAISPPARVALTLKTLAGFGVPEIARAFLTSEATIAQRLVRAKRTIRERGIPFAVPEADDFPVRLDSVLSVLYLLFNEGYTAHSGADLVRRDLCEEAIRLTSILAGRPVGDHPKVHALLALMLLQASRLPARSDVEGDLLLLGDQDRTLWDRGLIAAGLRELVRSAMGDERSEYHLQAAIAAQHAIAPDLERTNWQVILDQYTDLVRLTSSPVAALNRVVALSMVHGPETALAALEQVRCLKGTDSYYLLHATAGEFHRRAGNIARARECYQHALALTVNDAERRFLARRLGECDDTTGVPADE